MRTFIAIELNDTIREALARIETHLKYANADVRWVESANIHLTLKFLGDTPPEKITDISKIMDEVCKDEPSFEIALGPLGAFPRIEDPRVIWAGLLKGASEATRIATTLDDRLAKLGFTTETRPFAAHLTIGRVRSLKNIAALTRKMHSPIVDLTTIPPHHVTSIMLVQSTLTPKGSIYTRLYEARLRS